MERKLTSICDTTIEFGFYFLIFLAPMMMTRATKELFEFPKMLTVYLLTTFIVAAFLIRSIIKGQVTYRKSPLDIPMLLFFIILLLSSIYSIDKYSSLFGYYTRFHGGLISIICYLTLFKIFITEFSLQNKFKNFITVFMISTALLAFYGLLQHFGIDKGRWVQDSQARVFSTIGQPNWLAAYLAAILPLILSLALYQKDKLPSTTYYLLLILAYSTFWFTYSRSGIVGLIFAMLTFLSLTGIKFIWQKRQILTFLILVCTAISFFNFSFASVRLTETTAEMATTQKGSTGQIRFIVWKGTLDLIKKSPLLRRALGYGPSTFAYAFLPFRPKELNETSEWEFLYNKAHNEFLDTAATIGLLGLTAFILIIIKYCLWNFKTLILTNTKRIPRELGTSSANERLLLIGLFSGWLSLLITSFFGFLVVPTALLFWLFPAMSFAIINNSQ